MGRSIPAPRMVRGGRDRSVFSLSRRRLYLGLQKRSFGMGLRNALWISTVFLLSINLCAAPKLRLSNTVVGPIQVAQGGTASNVPAIEAANVGDGTLSLQVTPSPSATWLTASVG